jgi:ubiquinone/menaquinone biosynthesis C-methylase UbiE
VAADLSHGMLAEGVRRVGDPTALGLSFVNADALRLPLADDSVDAVLCALSVQYIQYPEAVFSEFARVLAPEGVLVVSFTNRMFPTKAVRAWRTASMDGRASLVDSYCRAAGLTVTDVVRERPDADPFYAVIARQTT